MNEEYSIVIQYGTLKLRCRKDMMEITIATAANLNDLFEQLKYGPLS